MKKKTIASLFMAGAMGLCFMASADKGLTVGDNHFPAEEIVKVEFVNEGVVVYTTDGQHKTITHSEFGENGIEYTPADIIETPEYVATGSLYIVGDVAGGKVAMETEDDGQTFTLTVEFTQETSHFRFADADGEANVFVPTEDNTEASTEGDNEMKLFIKGAAETSSNSWTVAPGTYDITVNLSEAPESMNFTITEVVEEGYPSTIKTTTGRSEGEEIKMVCVFETNDTNPVNAARYKLKKQQKALWDYVVMFSGNIDYNNRERPSTFNKSDRQDRPYFYANEGIQYILNHKDDILKPLKEMGTKVIMGILPNHDGAGLLNLSDEGIESFVEDLRILHEEYYIDGFFWDEEYAEYGKNSGTWGLTTSRGVDNFVKLLRKVKEVMPDAENMVYCYSSLGNLSSYQCGDIVDAVMPNYGASSSYYANYYPGTTNKNWGGNSIEASSGAYQWTNTSFRDGTSPYTHKPCFQFIFAPGRQWYEKTMDDACAKVAEFYYGDTLDETLCPPYNGSVQGWVNKQW